MKLLFTIIVLLGLVLSCTDPVSRVIDDDVQRSAGDFSYDRLDVRPNAFVINNHQDTFLWSQNNTLIYVPANAFLTDKNNHQVELYVKEYTCAGESLAQEISTITTDHRLLTSSTILHLEARQGNSEIPLQPRQELRLHFLRPQSPSSHSLSLWGGQPQAWTPLDFDRPKLFNHMLKIGPYNTKKFANGQTIDSWEKEHLGIRPDEEQLLWKEKPFLHLRFVINKRGMIENLRFKEPVTNRFQRRIIQEMATYPRCRPYMINGAPQRVQCEYAFHVHQAEPKYREDVSYIHAIQRNKTILETRNVDHIDDLELKYNIFNTKQLGWLAVGRAQPIQQGVDLIVELEADIAADVKVLMHESRAIILGRRQGNQVLFEGLPKNKAIHVIALGQRAKQPIYAEALANSSDGTISELSFNRTSYEELRTVIREMDHNQQ